MGNKTSQIIAASTLPPSATVITLNNSVLEAGVYNRVIHSAGGTMTLLLPPAPTDGMLVGFTIVGFADAFVDTAFDGNGKNIASNNTVASPVNQPYSSPVLFRFDADQDLWTVLSGSIAINN